MPTDQGSSTGMAVESAVAAENSARPKPIAQATQLSAPCSLLVPLPRHLEVPFLGFSEAFLG